MKHIRIILYFLGAVLISGCVKKAENLVDGWQELKWGMSIQQVQSQYPNAVSSKKESSGSSTADDKKELTFSEYEIAGVLFNVRFLFDHDDKLHGTILSVYPFAKSSLENEFNRLKDLMIDKYGPPTSIDLPVDGVERTVYAWKGSNTKCHLEHFVLRNRNPGMDPISSTIVISYSKDLSPENHDSNKL